MSSAGLGIRLAIWVAGAACLILCLNGADYLLDLARWGARNRWDFGELQGWGFRFLFHTVVTVLALALLVPAWLYMRFGARATLPRWITLATTLGGGLYAVGVLLEIYLPQTGK